MVLCQGPLQDTFADFWRMCWELRSATIVMMTKLEERTRIKCDQYWPTRGTDTYGAMTITITDVQELATYCIRTFQIHKVINLFYTLNLYISWKCIIIINWSFHWWELPCALPIFLCSSLVNVCAFFLYSLLYINSIMPLKIVTGNCLNQSSSNYPTLIIGKVLEIQIYLY